MRCWLLVLTLAVALISFPGGSSLAMTSTANFTREMQAHRQRLVEYAKILRAEYPRLFAHLSDQQIELYFDLHDKPKVQSFDQLAKFGYHENSTIGERLARYHGANLKQLSAEDAEELKRAIDDLNKVEKLEKAEFFREHRWSKSVIQALLLLERVSDITDVGIYRTLEMGLAPQLFDGAKYLSSKGEGIAAILSRFLENKIRSTAIPSTLSCNKILL